MGKIIAIVAILAVLGGGGYAAMKYLGNSDSEVAGVQNSEQIAQQQADAAPEKEEPIVGVGSIASLIARGENIKCDFSYTHDTVDVSDSTGTTSGEIVTSGTVFIADQYLRGNFEMSEGGVIHTSSVIQDETHRYIWGSSPQGEMAYKMAIPDGEVEVETSENDPIDMDEDLDYRCTKWTVNTSQFNPPSDVEFQDISAMMNEQMEAVMEAEGIEKEEMCAACDAAPEGPARDQCKAALGC